VFKELSQGRKVAIAGLNSEIDEALMEFKKKFKSVSIFRGKENLWSHNKHWAFRRVTYSQSQSQIELIRLMTSGIYQFWKYWIRDREYIESELKLMDPPPVALSLGSNVFFIFIILIIGLIVSAFAFLAENMVRRLVRFSTQKSKVSVESSQRRESTELKHSNAKFGDASIIRDLNDVYLADMNEVIILTVEIIENSNLPGMAEEPVELD